MTKEEIDKRIEETYNKHEKTFKYSFENLHRCDGGNYHPVGVIDSKSSIDLHDDFANEYKELFDWNFNGTYNYDDGDNKLTWLGLYNAMNYWDNHLAHNTLVSDIMLHKAVLFDAVKSDFSNFETSKCEKFALEQFIDFGYLAKDEEGRLHP